MTPPMADPMQPPLPTNPRQNSGVQAPMTPQVAQPHNTMNSLLSDKVQSESGDDGMMAQGGGMGDMTAATMGMCVKLASDRRRLVLIGLDPKTGHFRLLHRWYLGTSTLQWARSLLLFSTLRAWRAEDARGSTPTGDDPKAGS